jgi:hypothetical protein
MVRVNPSLATVVNSQACSTSLGSLVRAQYRPTTESPATARFFFAPISSDGWKAASVGSLLDRLSVTGESAKPLSS